MNAARTTPTEFVVVDATGESFTFAADPPRRIVSLVPSLTEALFALDLGDRLAGVTRFCEEPAELLAALPRVGGTKDPQIERVAGLRPDLVIASSEENREEDVTALRRAGVMVFVTHYPTVAAAIDGIALLARYLGADPDRQPWLIDARETAERLGRRKAAPVRYFCPIWRRPYMVARRATYMADLLSLAGGQSAVPDDSRAHYFAVDLNRLQDARPAVILLPDEPFRFQERHVADFDPLGSVPAVRDRRIHLVDGKALTWYGPRTGPALRYFDSLLHGGPGSWHEETSENGSA